MPKNFPANALIEANKQYGTEPVVIVDIAWATGNEQYGDKSLSLGTFNVKGLLSSTSPVSSTRKAQSSGEFSSMRVTLSDSNDQLKNKVNCILIEGTLATIYHHFDGLDQSDLVVLLKGRIYGDVEWDEERRQLSFTVEQFNQEREIGKSLEENEITDQAKDVEGVPWPYGFGIPVHVPALRVRRTPLGDLVTPEGINFIDETIFEFAISGGEDFPQNTPINILIGPFKYSGSLDGEVFTATGINLPRHVNLTLAERPRGDADEENASVCWLVDTDVSILGQYVLVNHEEYGYTVNYCMRQFGTKCFFRKKWTNDAAETGDRLFPILLDENDVLEETAPVARDTWPVPYRWQGLSSVDIRNPSVGGSYSFVPWNYLEVWQNVDIPKGEFRLLDGATVKLDQTFDDLYVFNVVPSVKVLQVYGTRKFDNEDLFVPIPSSYYTKRLNLSLAGENCSALEFATPLELRVNEEWTGEVFVSYISTVGPNIANIINHIANKYTNLTLEPNSYEATRLSVDPFPAHFAYFEQTDALQFIEEIAYQARCAAIIRNGELVLKYLSQLPITDGIIDEDGIQLESLELDFTKIDDIITRVDATFKIDYSDREEQERIFTYKRNTDQFGTIQDEQDFFIYHHPILVQMSVGFWGNRTANVWRKFKYNSFIENMDIQVFDVLNHNVPDISNNEIRSEIELQSHDTLNAAVELEGTLASKAGTCDSENQPTEDLSYWLGDPDYPILDPNLPPPCAQCNETDDPVPVPGGGGTPGGPGTPPEEPTEYTIVWEIIPTDVLRGTDFEILARVVDSTGDPVPLSFNGTMTLQSSDPSDALTGEDVQFVNGAYTDTINIDTSPPPAPVPPPNDTGTLTIFPNDNNVATSISPIFNITDGAPFQASCTVPATATRGISFAVAVTGGEPLANIQVNFKSTDSQDKLYAAGTEDVLDGELLVLDGAGNLNFNAEIRGGRFDDLGVISFLDPLNPPNTEVSSCGQIAISGNSPVTVVDSLLFEDFTRANGKVCELTSTQSEVGEGIFDLTMTIKNFDGSIATDFEGNVTIEATDFDENLLTWSQVCDNTNNNSTFIIGQIADGVWACAGLKIDIELAVTPITFSATTVVQENPEITATCQIVLPKAQPQPSPSPSPVASPSPQESFTLSCPANITRGVAFDVFIQAISEDGSEDTGYIPSGNVDLILQSTDGSDTITPLSTDATGWVEGKKTVSVTINGGTGSDNITITAQDDSDTARIGSCSLVADASFFTHNSVAFANYRGQETLIPGVNTFDPPPTPDNAWSAMQDTVKSNFLADVTLSSGVSRTQYSAINIEDDSPADIRGLLQANYWLFNLTPAERSGAISVTLRVRMSANDYLPTGPSTATQYTTFGNLFNFAIYTTETQNRASGAQVAGAPFQTVISGSEIVNRLWAQVNPTPPSLAGSYIEIELPLSALTSMVGNDLYVWTYLGVNPNIPLRPVTKRPTTAATIGTGYEITPEMGQKTGFYADADDAEIIIYK